MDLSSDLISQFVKVTDDRGTEQTETIIYGKVVTDGARNYVQIDGSSELAPIVSTVEVNPGDRVIVTIKNHVATVTGNISDPAIGTKTANGITSSITQTAEEIKLMVRDEVNQLEASISLTADQIRSEVEDEVNGLNSSIAQTASEIRAEIKNEVDGLNSTITQTASQIRTEIENEVDGLNSIITQTESEINTKITNNQNEFSEFKQTVEGFSFMGEGGTVKIQSGDINLTGAITWSMLSTGTKSEITDAQTAAATAQSTANSASSAASSAQSTANTANTNANKALTTVSGFTITENSTTYIDGQMIYSGTIYTDALHLGGQMTVYKTLTGSTVGGIFGYCVGWGTADGKTNQAGVGMIHGDYYPEYGIYGEGQCVCAELGARLSYGQDVQFVAGSDDKAYVIAGTAISLDAGDSGGVYLSSVAFNPYYDAGLTLGRADHKWSAIYASSATINTSDRNQKNSIEDLPEKYLAMLDLIRPVRYKLNDGTSDRYHVGYIAQEVEEAMNQVGIDSQEFGGFVKDVDEEGNDIYMLRYGEFDAIYSAKIKQLEARLSKLENAQSTIQ